MIKPILTEDGSHTLYHEELNETYHSFHGAITESRHVFIQAGLDYWVNKNIRKPIRIFEVGFGTGLNALLVWQYAQEHQREIQYTSIEAFPLKESIYSTLNYEESVSVKGFDNPLMKLHEADWEVEAPLSSSFSLKKLETSLQEVVIQFEHDVIFFDAFAPSKQPELWGRPMLEKVIINLSQAGAFVTYSAKGQLKRDLKYLGLIVESLPGPPGKKEMVRGVLSS